MGAADDVADRLPFFFGRRYSGKTSYCRDAKRLQGARLLPLAQMEAICYARAAK
jgi:hypothetical protein